MSTRFSGVSVPSEQARQPEPIDRGAARRRFARAAADPALLQASGFLAREAASRMAERLDYVRISPRRVLDAGCGSGRDSRLLSARYPEARVFAVDWAQPMARLARGVESSWPARITGRLLRRRAAMPIALCADMARLPLRDGNCDFVWSNLALPWVGDPLACFAEFARVLAPGGLLMFSTYGPDTLAELRGASHVLDAAMPRSASHVHRFADMHDLGDQLVQAGFSAPVMDMTRLTLTYESLARLFEDLRGSGERNVSARRARSLSGRSAWRAFESASLRLRREDGRIPVTVELVFGHAWRGEPRQASRTADGRSVVRFERR